MSAKNTDRVFVYGTLRHDGCNAGLLRRARFLGTQHTAPRFRLYDCGTYPGAMSGGALAITGEVYAVNRRQLRRLDILEAYPRLYIRERITTAWGPAWIYLLRRRPPLAKPLASGDWITEHTRP